jgi:hypothetical protein
MIFRNLYFLKEKLKDSPELQKADSNKVKEIAAKIGLRRLIGPWRKGKEVDNAASKPQPNRRRYFRIDFNKLLETDLTIVKVKGKEIHTGYAKVLVKNIGPGGLCFISNLRLPVDKTFILQFTMYLIDEGIRVNGHTVWTKEMENGLHIYGVEFDITEDNRLELIQELNQIQIMIRNNNLFAEEYFILEPPDVYFKRFLRN